MYLAYIDESGNFSLESKNSLEYVLTAVVIHESNWKHFQERSKSLKEMIWYYLEDKEYSSPPKDFEIHMKEICNRTGFFECLEGDDEKWFGIMKRVFERISKLQCKIISSIIIKDELINEGYYDVKKWAYELLIERLNRYIENESNDYLNEYLLTVLDTEGVNFDEEKRELMEELKVSGTGHGWDEYPDNVIETPFIVNSHKHLGVQIADAIAYVLRRYVFKVLERNPDAFFNNYCDEVLEKIGHLFYRSDTNRVDGYGVKIFPHTFQIDNQFWNIFKRSDLRTLDDF